MEVEEVNKDDSNLSKRLRFLSRAIGNEVGPGDVSVLSTVVNLQVMMQSCGLFGGACD